LYPHLTGLLDPMGNKERVVCAACGHAFKFKKGKPKCTGCGVLGVKLDAPPPKAKREATDSDAQPASKKRRRKVTEAAVIEYLEDLEKRVEVVDVTDASAMRRVGEACAAADVIALDLEGVALSRTGPISLIQLGAGGHVFLLDVLGVEKAAFSDGETASYTLSDVRALLESPTKRKLVWDVRRDSDALWHQCGVRLAGVLDVQLMEVALRFAPWMCV
jgi:hypothetical protein